MEQLIGSKLRKEYDKVVLLSPCLFNLYTEHTMRNAGLDELQAGIKIDSRNISSHRHTDDITPMAESEEELKSLLMRKKQERESKRPDLKLNIKKTKIIASNPITSWQIEGEKVELVTDFLFLGSKMQMMTAAMKSEGNCFLAGKLWQN